MALKVATAREYRTKYPDKPTKALARIMYNGNKELFTDVEDARGSLRYIEGKSGTRHRKFVKDTSFVQEEARPYNPYNLPDSDETIWEPYVLKGHKKLLGLFDIHAPYHNIQALSVAIQHGKKLKVDGVILGGDLFDFHGLSRFLRDPRKKNFAEELKIGVDIIQIIERTLKCQVYFKLGNHDERYQHYLHQKLGELTGVEDFEFANIIHKRLPDVKIIDDKRIIKANSLNIVHGHEFGMSVFSPVNIARGLYMKGKVSAIQGHNHISSEHTETDMNGKIVTTWSIGCLSEMHPAYLPINKWNHGCVDIELSGKEDFEVHNKRIYRGKIL